MKVWPFIKKALRVVVTAGVAIDVDAARERCERLERRRQHLSNHTETHLTTFRTELISLGAEKKAGYALLRRVGRLLRRANPSLRQFDETVRDAKFSHNDPSGPRLLHEAQSLVSDSTTELKAALGAVKGAGLASAAGIGSWALVAAFGTASTGTAIAGLSGAAATNATLAWFGGGALAAGGAGIAGGIAVLGGLIALPFLAFTIVTGYRAAKEELERLRQVEMDLNKAVRGYERYLDAVKQARSRTTLLTGTVASCRTALSGPYARLIRKIYPIPFISFAYRAIRRFITGYYYSAQEISALVALTPHIRELARAIKTPVFVDCDPPS